MISLGTGGGNPLQPRNPFSSLLSLLVWVGFLVLIYLIIKGFVGFLYWCAPVLLILALLIERTVVFKYAAQLVDNFKVNVLKGLVWAVFLVFGYPFVFFWLLLKAIFHNRVKKLFGSQEKTFGNFNSGKVKKKRRTAKDDEWTDYEEIK